MGNPKTPDPFPERSPLHPSPSWMENPAPLSAPRKPEARAAGSGAPCPCTESPPEMTSSLPRPLGTLLSHSRGTAQPGAAQQAHPCNGLADQARSSAATAHETTGLWVKKAPPYLPHTSARSSLRPCTGRSRQSHLFFSTLADKRQKKDGPEEHSAPAEPPAQQRRALRSYGATARPRRCHFVTPPGWFVVVNQHFPSSERRGASPEHTEEKNARLQAEEGKQSACEQQRAICGSACRPSKAEDGWSQGRRRARLPASEQEHPAVLSAPAPTRDPRHPSISTPDPGSRRLLPKQRLESSHSLTGKYFLPRQCPGRFREGRAKSGKIPHKQRNSDYP